MTGGDWSILDGASLKIRIAAETCLVGTLASYQITTPIAQQHASLFVICNVICALVIALATPSGLTAAARLIFVL